jgi:hypothetical protein
MRRNWLRYSRRVANLQWIAGLKTKHIALHFVTFKIKMVIALWQGRAGTRS